jgi:hypothetical protein
MSGGFFDYQDASINDMVEKIKKVIDENNIIEWYHYSPETIEEFKNAVDILEKASIYAYRIDWLISCDDGEDSFHEGLNEDLEKQETGYAYL